MEPNHRKNKLNLIKGQPAPILGREIPQKEIANILKKMLLNWQKELDYEAKR